MLDDIVRIMLPYYIPNLYTVILAQKLSCKSNMTAATMCVWRPLPKSPRLAVGTCSSVGYSSWHSTFLLHQFMDDWGIPLSHLAASSMCKLELERLICMTIWSLVTTVTLSFLISISSLLYKSISCFKFADPGLIFKLSQKRTTTMSYFVAMYTFNDCWLTHHLR